MDEAVGILEIRGNAAGFAIADACGQEEKLTVEKVFKRISNTVAGCSDNLCITVRLSGSREAVRDSILKSVNSAREESVLLSASFLPSMKLVCKHRQYRSKKKFVSCKVTNMQNKEAGKWWEIF